MIKKKINDYIEKILNEIEVILNPELHMQIAYHMISFCIVTKVGYISRVTPPSLCSDALCLFNERVIDLFIKKFDLPHFLFSLKIIR